LRFPQIAIFAAALLAATPVIAASKCDTPAEIGAMQFRQLQIELMVATLKCEGDFDYRGQYGAYVHGASAALADNTRQLRAMFSHHGKSAAMLDRYLTGMSNDAQIRSQSTENYCEGKAATLERIATLKPVELHTFAAETIGLPYGGEACPAATPSTKHHHVKQASKD
jgi:hypothetical protein